jgi:DNA-binding CsgD family transcriptional regulator
MSRGIELIALIELIYEAALDSDHWPSVLIRLADAVGAAQVAMPSMDRRANVVDTIAPRFDPDLLTCVVRHLTRAVRIGRRLWELELEHVAAAERLETLRQGALLVDASGRVVRANDAAKAMLDNGKGIFLDNGRLAAAGSEILQKLIASCAPTTPELGGPGGEFKIPREVRRSPLHVTVAPLRSKARLADVPWIGVGTPVAIVTVRDPDIDRRQQNVNLRRRFGLTPAEARLAAEILKGDGRAAAARRRRISTMTARNHLSSIFEKTGTHRQAELIRLLLDAADEDKTDI